MGCTKINKNIGVLCQQVVGLSQVAGAQVSMLNNSISNNFVPNPRGDAKI